MYIYIYILAIKCKTYIKIVSIILHLYSTKLYVLYTPFFLKIKYTHLANEDLKNGTHVRSIFCVIIFIIIFKKSKSRFKNNLYIKG